MNTIIDPLTSHDHCRCVFCKRLPKADPAGWSPGEVLLFGVLFACSVACAERWATDNAQPGYRPGEPGFRMEVEPEAVDPKQKEIEEKLHALQDRLEEAITRLRQQEERAKSTADWESEWRELRRREVAALELAATSIQGLGPMLTVHRHGPSEPSDHIYEPGRYGPWECKVCELPLSHAVHRTSARLSHAIGVIDNFSRRWGGDSEHHRCWNKILHYLRGVGSNAGLSYSTGVIDVFSRRWGGDSEVEHRRCWNVILHHLRSTNCVGVANTEGM